MTAPRKPLSDCYRDRDAVRLSHHEHVPGVTVDDYAGWWLVTDYRASDGGCGMADVIRRLRASGAAEPRGIVLKRRPDDLSRRAGEHAVERLFGQRPPDRWPVHEHGMTFEVSFTEAGFATGLFLDMAEGRRWVRDHADGADVLNLFSYTGAISIAAALGGARSVIEVDTARKWLTWAQRHQQLNGVTVVRQRRNDAVSFVQRADDAAFDLVICDPPSFATNGRKRFTVEPGYRLMAKHLSRVLRPGGWLLACCNRAQTDRSTFRRWLPRQLIFEQWIDPPTDFPGAEYFKAAVLSKR